VKATTLLGRTDAGGFVSEFHLVTYNSMPHFGEKFCRTLIESDSQLLVEQSIGLRKPLMPIYSRSDANRFCLHNTHQLVTIGDMERSVRL